MNSRSAVLSRSAPPFNVSGKKKNTGKADSPFGTHWVLVMDDEEIIRTVTRVMLEAAGYRVYSAQNGDEAIACYQEAKACGYPFDAVILSLEVRGGKGARETIKELMRLDPGLKAIVMSDEVNDPIMTDFGKFGFKGALTKPYASDDLEQTLRRVLIKERRDI